MYRRYNSRKQEMEMANLETRLQIKNDIRQVLGLSAIDTSLFRGTKYNLNDVLNRRIMERLERLGTTNRKYYSYHSGYRKILKNISELENLLKSLVANSRINISRLGYSSNRLTNSQKIKLNALRKQKEQDFLGAKNKKEILKYYRELKAALSSDDVKYSQLDGKLKKLKELQKLKDKNFKDQIKQLPIVDISKSNEKISVIDLIYLIQENGKALVAITKKATIFEKGKAKKLKSSFIELLDGMIQICLKDIEERIKDFLSTSEIVQSRNTRTQHIVPKSNLRPRRQRLHGRSSLGQRSLSSLGQRSLSSLRRRVGGKLIKKKIYIKNYGNRIVRNKKNSSLKYVIVNKKKINIKKLIKNKDNTYSIKK